MFISVKGNGSFSVAYGPIWKGPDTPGGQPYYEISDDHAEECLAFKEEHPSSNFIISATEPTGHDEFGKPSWMLRPSDFAGYEHDDDEIDRASPDADYEPQDDEFPCPNCAASFTSEPGLAQHTMLKHANIHGQIENEARAQLEAERQRKATEERIKQADPKSIRPEERPESR